MEYNGKSIWTEDPNAADSYRLSYFEGLMNYIKANNKASLAVRRERTREALRSGKTEELRKEYLDMLGVQYSGAMAQRVTSVLAGEDDVSFIYRLTVTLDGDVPFYAMLLKPKAIKGKTPLVVFQHGGGGTPELAADFYGKNSYGHKVRHIIESGYTVLMPQLILWARKEIETQRCHPIDFDRINIDNSLKRFGTSITGFEVTAIMRCIDYAVALDFVDSERIGMIGLSYGGYFTLHTMAADTRIIAGYSAGVINNRDIYDRHDMCYRGSAKLFQDAEVAALCAPRWLCIEAGKEDGVFDIETAISEMDAVKMYFEEANASDMLMVSVHDGAHRFSESNLCLDSFLRALDEGKAH